MTVEINRFDLQSFSERQQLELLDLFENQLPHASQIITNKTIQDCTINNNIDATQILTGILRVDGGTTGGLNIKAAEAAANITATSSITIPVQVPSGAIIIGCQLRVDSALTGGELWDAAYATGSTQAIASAAAVAKNTKVNKFFDPNAATPIASAATDVAITKNGGGSFTAQGNIRAIVYYLSMEAMADAA